MSRPETRLLRTLAQWLVRNAGALVPDDQKEWARAMEAEVSAIPGDHEAFRWAVGCFAAAHLLQVRAHLRYPSAYLPLAMSLVATGMVLIHAGLYGIVASPDEGTPAHIFQLLMVAQFPVIALFAIRRLPAAPTATLQVMLLQFAAACCAIMAVVLLT